MNKKKRIVLCITLFIVNVLLIVFLSELIVKLRLQTKEVYVADLSIPRREKINEEYLKTIKVPKCFLNDDIYYEKDDIVGKYVKLNAYIPKGSLIYKDYLESEDEMADAVHLNLKENETTYDLFVKDIEVNTASLLSGMKVDIYLTVNKKEILSDLLISNAKISTLYDNKGKEIKNPNDNLNIAVISIVLNKDYVAYLNKAIVIGDVKILVSNDLYSGLETKLNNNSEVFKLLS